MHCILISGYGCSGKSTLGKKVQRVSAELQLKSDIIPQALFIKTLFSVYFGRTFQKTIQDRLDMTELAWALKGRPSQKIDQKIAIQELNKLFLDSSKIGTLEFFPDLSYQFAKQENLDLMIIDDLRYPYEQNYYLNKERKVLTIKTTLDEQILNERILSKYGHTLEELKKVESEQHYHEIKEDFLVDTSLEDCGADINLEQLLKEFLQN